MLKNLLTDPVRREQLRTANAARLQERAQRQELDAEQQASDKARAERLARARCDFAYFCREYLPEAFPTEFSPYQLALTRMVSERQLSREDERLFKSLIDEADHPFIVPPDTEFEGILDIEPRDHGKTTRNTQALPLWLMLNFPGAFIVIAAASKDSAIGMAEAVRLTLEENERIIEDYGSLRGSNWSKNKMSLANGSALVAVGARQSLRGVKNKFRRPTHIICDDLLKDDEVESPVRRKHLYTWFKRVVLNLGQGALTIVANTIMHPDDLPSRLLGEIESGQLTNWIGLRFSAITPDGRSLWPQRWPMPLLRIKERTLGAAIWATEWMNKPIADEDRTFHTAWFEYFNGRDIVVSDCDVVMGVDPATGTEKGDYSAIAVAGKQRATGVYFTLFCNGWRESDLQFAKRIIDIYLIFKPRLIVFEEVAFQKIYKREVAREGSRRNLRLPLTGFKGGDKHTRIKSLAPLVENGLLLFQDKNQELLLQQLEMFPKGHDDCPDALEMAIQALETTYVGGAPVVRQVIKSAAQQLSGLASRFGRMRG